MCLFVITDKHWFAENLLCLLSNAVKYSDGGIVTLTVEHIAPVLENVSVVHQEISNSSALLTDDKSGQQVDEAFNNLTKENALTDRPVVVSGPMIKISVEDFGIGIPEEDRVELFQPFKQVQRLAGGTGLGLFSLSTRISALDGSRGMSSRKDGKQGSVFWFSIPYLPDPNYHSLSSPDAVKSPSLGPSGSSTPIQTDTVPQTGSVLNIPVHVKNRLRFLLVDDSPSILKVVGRALESKKYDVDTAVNGCVALSLLIQRHSTRSLDVVLMDLQMPVMDGIEAVRRYREYETAQHKGLKQDHSGKSTLLPADYTVNDHISSPLHGHPATVTADPHRLFIIGMSANSDAVTKQCAHDVGMDAFLAKPFAIADLQLLVDSIRSSNTI
jgi:CheY-like chemotaxis protein